MRVEQFDGGRNLLGTDRELGYALVSDVDSRDLAQLVEKLNSEGGSAPLSMLPPEQGSRGQSPRSKRTT